MRPGRFSLGGREGGREGGKRGGLEKATDDEDAHPHCSFKMKREKGGREDITIEDEKRERRMRGDEDLLARTQRNVSGSIVDEMLVRLIDHQPGPCRVTKGGNLSERRLRANGAGGVARSSKDNDLDQA